MPDFGLEVVFVVMGPREQGRNEFLQMWRYDLGRKGVDRKLDISKNGLDNLAIGRRKEYKQSGKYLRVHFVRDGV